AEIDIERVAGTCRAQPPLGFSGTDGFPRLSSKRREVSPLRPRHLAARLTLNARAERSKLIRSVRYATNDWVLCGGLCSRAVDHGSQRPPCTTEYAAHQRHGRPQRRI